MSQKRHWELCLLAPENAGHGWALQELVAYQSATYDAWVIKGKLRWIQKGPDAASGSVALCVNLNPYTGSVS